MRNVLLFAAFCLLAYGCFEPQKPPENVSAWIVQKFHGQLEVKNAWIKMPEAYSIPTDGMWQALVVDKSNPEVQFLLIWKEKTPDFGLNVDDVQAQYEYAQEIITKGEAVCQWMEEAGVPPCAINFDGTNINLFVFAEPSPENRTQIITRARPVLERYIQHTCCWTIRISLLEPAGYRQKFQVYAPKGVFYTDLEWIKAQTILTTSLNWDYWNKSPDEIPRWELNSQSDRCSTEYLASARLQALTWAKTHLPASIVLEPGKSIPFEFQKNPDANTQAPARNTPGLRFAFPYFETKAVSTEQPKGYITGVYFPDDQSFTTIRMQSTY
jgi:hypothetical protein